MFFKRAISPTHIPQTHGVPWDFSHHFPTTSDPVFAGMETCEFAAANDTRLFQNAGLIEMARSAPKMSWIPPGPVQVTIRNDQFCVSLLVGTSSFW